MNGVYEELHCEIAALMNEISQSFFLHELLVLDVSGGNMVTW
jgi:hypothetical protein